MGRSKQPRAEVFLTDVIHAATRPDRPAGCFTVQAGLTCSTEDQEVAALLTERRKDTETALRQRFKREDRDALPAGMTAASLARFIAALAVGINVKAGDGASRSELRALTTPVAALFAT